jgi:hypothetical protein
MVMSCLAVITIDAFVTGRYDAIIAQQTSRYPVAAASTHTAAAAHTTYILYLYSLNQFHHKPLTGSTFLRLRLAPRSVVVDALAARGVAAPPWSLLLPGPADSTAMKCKHRHRRNMLSPL